MFAKRSEIVSRIPVLAGLLVACNAAAAAITLHVNEPAYELTLHLSIVFGLAISLVSSAKSRNLRFVAAVFIIAGFALYTVREIRLFPITLLYPAEMLFSQDLALTSLIAWFMTGLCFVQARRENAVIAVACGLAIFGLMGTLNLNAELLVSFAVYLFASIYVWAYDNLLTRQDWVPAGQDKRWLTWGRRQLGPAALLFVAMVVVAGGVGNLLYRVSPNLFPQIPVGASSWMSDMSTEGRGIRFGDEFVVGNGSLQLSERVVFTVKADYPSLWRARAYHTYDGHSWRGSQYNQRFLHATAKEAYVIPGATTLQGVRNRQRYHIVEVTGAAIYGAAHPQNLRITDTPTPMHPPWQTTDQRRPVLPIMTDALGNISAALPLLPGTEYEVVSVMPDFTPMQLSAAAADYPEWLRRQYIEQVPLPCQAQLTDLVQQITAGASSPYDKVRAIMSYLSENYLYTTKASPVPKNRDAAVHLLLHSRRGACDLFATAMVVMCRMADIPARMITGFAPGEYDSEEQAYVVRGTDAHAWVEVYFPGWGWVPFNPHANESLEEQNLSTLLWRYGQFGLVIGKMARTILQVLAVAAVLGLAASAIVHPAMLRRWWRQWRDGHQPWSRLEKQWRRFYKIVGLRLDAGSQSATTPAELLAAAAGQALIPAKVYPLVSKATEELYQLRYSGQPVSASQVEHQQRRWGWLTKRIKRARRRSQ